MVTFKRKKKKKISKDYPKKTNPKPPNQKPPSAEWKKNKIIVIHFNLFNIKRKKPKE